MSPQKTRWKKFYKLMLANISHANAANAILSIMD